jgi:hypothetical protein
MVDLEAAELHAARERDERFTRRASSASPRRLRRRGRFWDRQYAPIEVESLPPELEDASLLRGAYDTTPRIPPGLGGERWETWRHVPTVVGAPHDDSRASHKPSAPPGLNPDGRAPPMAVSTSIVGKVTAKCYDVDTRDPKAHRGGEQRSKLGHRHRGRTLSRGVIRHGWQRNVRVRSRTRTSADGQIQNLPPVIPSGPHDARG